VILIKNGGELPKGQAGQYCTVVSNSGLLANGSSNNVMSMTVQIINQAKHVPPKCPNKQTWEMKRELMMNGPSRVFHKT